MEFPDASGSRMDRDVRRLPPHRRQGGGKVRKPAFGSVQRNLRRDSSLSSRESKPLEMSTLFEVLPANKRFRYGLAVPITMRDLRPDEGQRGSLTDAGSY